MTDIDTAIVGAGLAGLACATHLEAAGISAAIFEASDGVGGRVRSDVVDGFTLDRGFQILLTSYPELIRLGLLDDLNLARFNPGAVVRVNNSFARVGDPFRQVRTLIPTAVAPIGSLSDKLKILRLRRQLTRSDPVQLMKSTQLTTRQELTRRGFSPKIIERFFQPLLSGIQLMPDLDGPAAMFLTIMRALTVGEAAVPSAGMGALPALLATRLNSTPIHLNSPVSSLTTTGLRLEDGQTIMARNVVLATDGPTAAHMAALPAVGSNVVTALYFAADQAPLSDKAVVLNGTGKGLVTNMAVMSNVSPAYAPPGRALIVAAIVASRSADTEQAARRQLGSWFGNQVDGWETVAAYEIPHAQPSAGPPFLPTQPVRLGLGRYVCGDHRDTPSIQGALYSGRRAAAALIADRVTSVAS